jgi:putative ABC transport system permease protein
VRVAIGATEEDVQRQFLLESVVLSLLGGAAGILVGIGSSITITHLLHWTVSVPAWAVGAAVLFSTAIGIGFGYYPARKAARLDPIEALRFE